MRFVKGLLLIICVWLGIFAISQLDKGIETQTPDRIYVYVYNRFHLEDVVKQVPGAHVFDEGESLVQVPYGKTQEYVKRFQADSDHVVEARGIPETPHFSLPLYVANLKNTLVDMVHGQLGSITYRFSATQTGTYPIASSLQQMFAVTSSYLFPALFAGLLLGYVGALLAVWLPRVGKVLDLIHALLLGIPDFFMVLLLQMGAIRIDAHLQHPAIFFMQTTEGTPYLIPLLAILILPGALIYGAVRLAVAREWEEAYIQTAYAKGLSRTRVFFVHLLRNTQVDLFAILPRAVTVGVGSMVVAELMTNIFGLGGYALNASIAEVTSLPTTCLLLSLLPLVAHFLFGALRKRVVVQTKEGA